MLRPLERCVGWMVLGGIMLFSGVAKRAQQKALSTALQLAAAAAAAAAAEAELALLARGVAEKRAATASGVQDGSCILSS